MSHQLVRTTTYFDQTLLKEAKRKALEEEKKLYEVLNEALEKSLKASAPMQRLAQGNQPATGKLFPTFRLGLGKKRITRASAYE